MAAINEIKEKMGVVKSVGGFANALQQIASMRMMTLRDKVLSSKRFVDEATEILRELNLYKEIIYSKEYKEAVKRSFKRSKNSRNGQKNNCAVIVVTSNQGLCGKYNAEIFKKLETIVFREYEDADYYLIGKKGQEHYLTQKKFKLKFYPYNVPDNFDHLDLLRLVQIFPHYQRVMLVYSRYINTINRDVVETLLVAPPNSNEEEAKDKNIQNEETVVNPVEQKERELEKIKYIFEPSLEELIKEVSAKLRAATFQQQILDSRLAQFSAQMVGMQAASENSKVLLDDLGHEYNKYRRKMIDKKISEVLGGSALW